MNTGQNKIKFFLYEEVSCGVKIDSWEFFNHSSTYFFKIADDFSLAQLTLAMFFIAICGHDYIDRVFDPFVMEEFFKFFRKNYLTLGRQ